ncbi:Cyclic nucleotide-gated ion channel 1 [Morella rubra]|uniref:Cyclic nucleotide-gated ion channel 1 n=1 Tax=Morella rubra TaxID=262757 RepID=A0A6A1UL57_9ROSI|nr:Cyclic nucleotide-gated ion channel 1 [Morella rubra]
MVTDLIHMAPTIRALSVIMGSRVAILRDTRAKKAKGTERDEPKQKEMRSEPEAKGTKAATKNFLKWKVLISILAILPAPQVLVSLIFSETDRGLKVLNAVVLCQYAPRVFRIYQSWEKLLNNKILRVVVVNAAFNIFLYIIASHSNMACRKQVGCTPSSSRCNHRLAGNYTFLNEHCPMTTPNSTAFDFGIFTGALQSGIVTSTNLPEKMVQCFWWGLRNLSNKDDDVLLKSSCDALLKSICDALRPRYGNENSYIIREGEPLDKTLFINRGIICTYTSNQKNQTGCLKPGDFYGKDQLLDNWLLKSLPSSHPSNLSFSKMTLKCLTKVEAFSLKGSDPKNIESRHPVKIVKLRQFNANSPVAEQEEQAEQLRRTAISFLREMRLSRQRRFPTLSHLG